jgi:diguanylate cyclase (GGDEF)-like protein/putative nucleotidyltransferase with HDIG domain
MWPKTWSRPQLAVVSMTLAYVVGFILLLLNSPVDILQRLNDEKLAESVTAAEKAIAHRFSVASNIFQSITPLFAGVCGVMYAIRGENLSTNRRWGYALVGIGSALYGVGQVFFTYFIINDIEAFPSVADIPYLGAYPFLIAGVILLFGSMPTAGRARILLDSGIAASGLGVICWYFIIGPNANSDQELMAKFLTAAYPLCDVFVLFSALLLFNGASTNHQLRRSSAFLCAGLTFLAITDTAWNLDNANGTYTTGKWFDAGWPLCFLLVAYSSLVPMLWPAAADEKTAEAVAKPVILEVPRREKMPLGITLGMLGGVLAPYIAAAVAFSLIAYYDYQKLNHISNPVLIAGLWLIGLVILRQVLTLLENGYLTTQLRSLNTDLEKIVQTRTSQLSSLTEQLAGLLELTKAVNTTLKVDQVLKFAAEHTQRSLQADAVVVRLLESNATGSDHLPRQVIHRGLENRPEALRFIEELATPSSVEIVALPIDAIEGKTSPGICLQGPLRWHNRAIGVVGAIRWDANNAFDGNEPQMLESIGVEVGAALENARIYAEAVEAADRDSVTGLYNHRAIHQRLDSEFHRAERQLRPLTIIMMDLNNFKLFNDTYGHPVGDQVLKRVADVLESECRKCDILGRYGGDEFIAILPDTDVPLAMVVAQRLRSRMALEGFRHKGEANTVPVTLSFGIATFPDDSKNRFELVALADANLYTAKISESGIIGTSETQRSNRGLRKEGAFDVLDAMVTAVDNKDRYTRRHSEDVTEYALWIAEEMGLSEETMRVLRIGALLHDVGKIGVPEDVLRKPGRLTDDEYEVMKRHPHLGALIVSSMPGMESIVDIVRSHHERWDGKGYPDGLKGEEIPILGRLLAVADAYSAMTTARPYRKGKDWQVAAEEIRANIHTQFDPKMAEAFLNAVQKRRPLGFIEEEELAEDLGPIPPVSAESRERIPVNVKQPS